ncbi:MAG: hypothetical protein FJW80_08110 [Actinobacteria bacterium]|nr:hypothetical protein [Actinomycetota bacterium]
MRLLTRFVVPVLIASLALPTTVAIASDGHHASSSERADYSLSLKVDRVKASTGQVKFTVTPKGFTYVKVSDAGAPNVAGEGHAHIYAKDTDTGKVRYIGWTGNGLTDWSDPGRLKPGKTYRIYAIFSENDHTEQPRIRSRAVTVTMS